MISRAVFLTKAESLADEIARAHDAIARRAYEMFQQRGDAEDRALDDWLEAERELFRRPAANLHRTESGVEWLVAVPDVEPDDLEVRVSPESFIVQSMTAAPRIFVSVDLSDTPIDQDAALVDVQHGLLRLTAPVARPAAIAPTVVA
jgi:HSP20 family molecular chaperone IbpA